MGDGFSVDPDKLRDEATKRLNTLIDDVNAAREKVRAASQYKPFDGGGDVFTGIESYWQDTLYYLNRVLEDNARNLELDRDALREIADRYEGIESASAEEVRRW